MESNEKKWRFKDNGYGQGVGLNEGGIETFKDNPDASLAREICQNSIDARIGDKPAVVEFKTFKLDRNRIYGVDDLASEIENCYRFRIGKQPEEKQLKSMLDCINQDVLICLRISDFNTTGLIGVSNDEIDKPFYNLTKGSGTSDKTGTSGGSKGIGKFAAFEASLTNTVFYSTRTTDGEIGGIGISKLRSAPIEGKPKLLTQGIGYFGLDHTNAPILQEIKLDTSFSRTENQTGTDLFLIGYNDTDNWKEIIACEILDSFIIAILEDKLNVIIEDIKLNKETLYDILYNSNILDAVKLKTKKSIKSQYELYTGSSETNVYVNEFEIAQGTFKVYVKQYNSNNETDASKQCIMIRYPFMKIKYETGFSYLPYSAMVIIGDNTINQRLREIENPQHTGWYINRLNNYKEEKRITQNMLGDIRAKTRDFIQEVLSSGTGSQTDVEGAGDYLPSFEEEGLGENFVVVRDKLSVSKVKKVDVLQPKTEKNGEEGNSYKFSKGDLDNKNPGDGRGLRTTKTPPNPNPDTGSKDFSGFGEKQGDKPIIKKVALNGIKYRNIAVNSKIGQYDTIFESNCDEPNCEFELKQFGEAGGRYKMNIINATINGESCKVENGVIVGFEIKKGVKYKISYTVDSNELFASEVTLNACR